MLRFVDIIYYASVIATASVWSIAVDWRPGAEAETGFVIREPYIWWAVLSLLGTVGLYLYRRKWLKRRSR